MRLVLVGENNPFGGDDSFALYPAPDGCAGHRLCRLVLGMRRADYMRSFERVNLVRGPWSAKEARSRAAELCEDARSNRGPARFILLGARVCKAFGLLFLPFDIIHSGDDAVLILPHPSGRNRLWNDPEMFIKARAAVAKFVTPEVAAMLGEVVSQ